MVKFDIATKFIGGFVAIGAQQALYSHLVPSPTQIRAITDEEELERIKKDAQLAFIVSEGIALSAGFILKDARIAAIGTLTNIIFFTLFVNRGIIEIPEF